MAPPKGRFAGDKNPNWKGGRTVTEHGYVLVKRPDHPNADVRGYVYEHRLKASEVEGRPLRHEEQVHHENQNRADNDGTNLELMPSALAHGVQHRKRTDLRMPDEPNITVSCECGCGGTFLRYDGERRPRRFLPHHNIHRRRP